MKKIILFTIGTLFSLASTAQEKKDGFSDFLEEELNNFDSFVDEANKNFIRFMRDPWKEFKAEKPVKKRLKPEPVKPVVYDEKTTPKDQTPVCLKIEEILDMTTAEGRAKPVVKVKDADDITFDTPKVIIKKKKEPTVIVVEEKVPEKKPVTHPTKKPVVVVEPVKKPVKETPEPTVTDPIPVIKPAIPVPSAKPNLPVFNTGEGRKKTTYGGEVLYLNNALDRECKLSGTSENAITDAYESLSESNYQPLLKDILSVKSEMRLNDWGMYQLVKSVADTYCATANESIVMQQFLLNEMGYKARIARKTNDNKLVLYVAPDCQLFGSIYIVLNGQKYYDLNSTNPYQFFMCQLDSPKAKNTIDMHLKSAPVFSGEHATVTRQAKGSATKATVSVSKKLMDFYKSYPQCDYGVYANAGVASEVEEKLLSSLSAYVSGKSEVEAANLLINFVQTGFEYERDELQFGYEKPFFVEELFYYPYSDCEDRSILFAYLVRKLMKRDVVFLDYPEHIATAVCFNENVGGDYIMVEGKKYTVCDPTYVGATIGMTMPQFKQVAAKVLKY
ncbi:MAG: hypothetical protein RR386_05770 [Bacteroidaceae bacterium]